MAISLKEQQRHKRDPLQRVKLRPLASEWNDTEPVTLVEAIALLFPAGPLTVSSLRSEIQRGNLGSAKVAGKIFTTIGAIHDMMEPKRASQERQITRHTAPSPSVRRPYRPDKEQSEAARTSLELTLERLREQLRRK